MEIYLQQLLSTVLRKLIVPFKRNPLASYESSVENLWLRVELSFSGIDQLGLDLDIARSGYFFSC
jgi:hypothetical protein